MLSPVLHAASNQWMLGTIENHTAKPMSLADIEAHIKEHERLRQLCAEQSDALKWAKELLESRPQPAATPP